MAAHVIGKVQALQGIVQVRDQNGKIHNLMVGDELLEGQVLLTGSGHLTIAFADGGTANIGAGQTVAITAELSAHFFPGADEAHVSGVASANAAAHAILHGGDLNQILDAPAAGADLANEGHSFVQLLRIVEAVDLGPGATTAGVTVAAFARESVLPIHEAQTFVNHTPDVTAPSAGGTVFEAGLPARDTGPAGSHSGDPNDPVTTTGTVSFNSPDGVQSVTLGGHTLTGTSTTFTDATGSLTASYTYDVAHGTGTITYSYTLLNNTSGDGITVTLPVVVTDPQGDANTATNVVVSVVNDLPTANPGSSSGVEGATVTGNVLTDGAKPDVFGADGPAAGGGVVGVAHSGDTSTSVTTGVDTAIAGSFGTLTVHDDGTYTYVGTPNTVPPAGATDTFIYTIKDGDGDLSTSTLTINLTDAGLSATSPTITVDEAALSTGSNPSSPAETAGGTLGVTGAVSYAFAAGHDGAGSHGTLTLHADGSYSYTLTSAENSGPIQGPNVVNGAETFFYTATDAQGNTVDGAIVVNIKDDVPTAYADSNSGADGATLTGNVLTDGVHADVFGADGPAAGGGVVGVSHSSDTSIAVTTGVETAIVGSYGTLTVHGNGTYTYVGTPNAVPTGGATDTFTYTIKDGDGDLSTSMLSIALTPAVVTPPPLPPADHAPVVSVSQGGTVYEAGLPGGSGIGPTTTAASGTFTVADGDGLSDIKSVTINGTTITIAALQNSGTTPIDIHSANGTLEVTGYNSSTGVASYTYTLTSPETTNPAANDDHNTVNDSFTLKVTDNSNVSSAPATLVIGVVDDVPTAGNDSITTTVGHAVSGNLATNDVVGADAPGTWAVDASSPAGHGTVSIDPDSGHFTYTPNAGYQGPDSFGYTLTDHDGDVATATVTVTIDTNGAPTIVVTDNNNPGATDGQVTVNEAGLPGGTHAGDGSNSTTGTIVVTAPNGLASIDFGLTNVTAADLAALGHGGAGDTKAISTPDGTLTLTGFDAGTGTISYTYSISAPQTAAGDSVLDTLNLTVHDSVGGTSVPATFGATILDDVPTAGNDSITTTVGHAVSGNLATNDVVGADAPGTWAVDASSPAGHGTVSIDPDSGHFTYTPNAGYQGPDSFGYTLTDHDGDVATATVTVTIDTNGAPTIVVTDNNNPGATDGQVTVNEAGLPGGTHAGDGSNSTTGTIVVTAPNGLASIDFGLTNVTAADLAALGHGGAGDTKAISTPDGTLTLTGFDAGTGTISYTYSISAPQTAAGDSVLDTLNLTVHDSVGGTSVPATFGATILDDVPTAGNDSITTTVGHAVSGNLATNDVVGADAPGTWAVDASSPAGHGTVSIDPDSGHFTYTPNAGYQGPDSFGYTLTDHDGDVATATVTVTIDTNGAPTIVVTDNNNPGATDGQVTVNEAGLPGGTHAGDGSNSTTGTIVVTAPNGLASIDFGLTNVTAADLAALGHGGAGDTKAISTPDGTLTLTGFDAGTGTISYTYSISAPQTAAGDSVLDTLNLTVHDSVGGTSVPATFGATILDDVPTAYTVTNSGTEGGTVSGNVLTDGTQADVFGADGPSTVGGGVVGVAHSSDTTTAVTTGLNTPITGSYGTLTLHADGTYTYTGTPNTVSPAGATDTFTYTIQDGDGDQSTATLNINLSDSNVAPVVGTAMASVSEQGLPGGLPDANGTSTDTTNSATASGSISISDPGSTISSVTLIGPTGITSDGVAVTWTGNGTAGNPLVGHAGSTTIATVTIDNSGHYSFTLNGPIDQIGPNSNSGTMLPLNFGVTATNTASQTGSGTLTINVEDDHPVAQSTASFTESATNTNIQVILDVSGSMTSNHDGLNGTTRLTTAVEAIESLLNSYASTGNVMVNLVTFSSSAQQLGSSWLSIPDAKTYLNALTASGFTYYDSALNTAQTAYTTSGALTAANTQNVTYFVSDGAPTSGHSVSSTLQSTWQSFLTSHDILSYALGIGSGAEQAPLNPVAYNGQTSTDTDAVLVANIGQLSSVLEGTVQAPVHGNVISGQAGAGVGADGGFVQSITVEGTTYTFTPGTNSVSATGATNHGSFDSTSDALNVTTSTGGTWTFNMVSGAYSYQAPNVSSGQTESLGYVISDNDGDTANSSISVALANNAVYPPSDILFGGNDTLSASGSGTTAVANNSILFTLGAIDPSGSHFTFTNPNPSSHGSGSNVAYDTVTTYIESVNGTNNETFTINNSTDTVTTTALSYSSVQNLSINIQVADEHGQTRTETVDLRLGTNNGGDTLGSATDTNDQVIYGFGGNDTITGGKGNDALYGGAGTDTLIETSGTNRLIGGAGNDTMTGGTGSDTFVWHLADKGTSSSPAADTITNFDATHATSSSGDVLALNDLVPDAAWSGGASALASYLHFATTGSNVTVSISSTGNLTSGVDQTIVLQGVTLASLGTAGSGSADQQIIQSLLNNGHLVHNG